jgi:hypothetical protein
MPKIINKNRNIKHPKTLQFMGNSRFFVSLLMILEIILQWFKYLFEIKMLRDRQTSDFCTEKIRNLRFSPRF